MKILAEIKSISYKPLLCRKLEIYGLDKFESALENDATFLLKMAADSLIAISWWVSPKRTRSYPYARVYDNLNFPGKKVTIIPVFKDEGIDGDRDFLQWDTISLMSLLGVYTILSYYVDAEPNNEYRNKITGQKFAYEQIRNELNNLISYQSDALHWNLEQIDKVGHISQKAFESYERISRMLGIEMHSGASAKNRIRELIKGRDEFMYLSRRRAQRAQVRESITIQPKEKLSGAKAILTIKNYLGGFYFLTADEAKIEDDNLYLIEGKHSTSANLPSTGDIKDGLLKMILFVNLEDVTVVGHRYNIVPVLKLTTKSKRGYDHLGDRDKERLNLLKQEASINRFRILFNNDFLA